MGRGRIFINYRRDDAEREADHLATFLGAGPFRGGVFIDKSGLRHKPDWLGELERQVNASDAMVAVIGPGWTGATDAAGQRRLDDPNDFVRFELARAFARAIPVIPVLIDGARMPTKHDLPDGLLPLLRPQAMPLRQATFRDDATAIAGRLNAEIGAGRRRGRPVTTWAAVMLALALGGLGGLAGAPQLLPLVGGSQSQVQPDGSEIATLKAAVASAVAERGSVEQSLQRTIAETGTLRREVERLQQALDTAKAESARDLAEQRRIAGEAQAKVEMQMTQIEAFDSRIALYADTLSETVDREKAASARIAQLEAQLARTDTAEKAAPQPEQSVLAVTGDSAPGPDEPVGRFCSLPWPLGTTVANMIEDEARAYRGKHQSEMSDDDFVTLIRICLREPGTFDPVLVQLSESDQLSCRHRGIALAIYDDWQKPPVDQRILEKCTK